MLDFINYPVSAILWFWHTAFGYVLDPASGYTWALAVIFLVFTVRALLFKPFVQQVRSMKKMQDFAPQVRALQQKYGDDKQRMAQELQKLQSEQGFNPLSGCLPMLVQVPVFIGLFQVLTGFKPGAESNFVFDRAEVASFVQAELFGASLSSTIAQAADRASMLVVGVPLMIVAAVATHFTARHSVARQSAEQSANTQAAIMNKLTLWLFPAFALIVGPFLPLAILLYWLANNAWTLAQQRIVFSKIDREEAERAEATRVGGEHDSADHESELVASATNSATDSNAGAGVDTAAATATQTEQPGEVSGLSVDRSRDGVAPDEDR